MIRDFTWPVPGSEHVSRHAPLGAPVSRRVAIIAAHYPGANMAKAKPRKSGAMKQKRTSKAKTPTKRANTKQAQLIAMLQRPDGATIDEIVKKLEWQSHTVRGVIAGALKKRLKLKVESEKVENRGRVYRIAP
jgi:hypothetical protein